MHDIVVLGGGPAGYAAAFRGHARGLDVALVEAEKVGGTCLHRGCIPSKATLHVAEVLEEVHRAEVLGLRLSYDGLDGDGLEAFRRSVIDGLHTGLAALAARRATVHEGTGRVVRDGEGLAVEVTGSDGATTTVAGRHVVLATGSVPKVLPGVDVDGEVVQTSDQALWFTSAPRRAVIVGGGAIGVEFATMWAPMGTEVTVVEALDRLLPLEDADSSKLLTRSLRRAGTEVLTDAMVGSIARNGDGAQVSVEVDGDVRTIVADRVLLATGRSPRTADTGAADLGVLDERGFVVTDAYGATDVTGLWAAGDVRPTLALAHAAFAEGFVVADRIAGVEVAPVDHVHTPRVTYSRPEVASVGLTEAAARERFGDAAVDVATVSFKGNAKGIIAGLDGHVKVVHATGGGAGVTPGVGVADPTGSVAGPVLGVHVVGPHATDLIAAATSVTAWEALPVELAAITHAHPTLSEALGEAFQLAAGLPFHTHG